MHCRPSLLPVLCLAALTAQPGFAHAAQTEADDSQVVAQAAHIEFAPDAAERFIAPAAKPLPALKLFPKTAPAGRITLGYKFSMLTNSMAPETVNPDADLVPMQVLKRRYYASGDPLDTLSIDTAQESPDKPTEYANWARSWNGLLSLVTAPIAQGPISGAPRNQLTLSVRALQITDNHWAPLREGSSLSARYTLHSEIPGQASSDSDETLHCKAAAAVPASTLYGPWPGLAQPITCTYDNGETPRSALYYYIFDNGLVWMAEATSTGLISVRHQNIVLAAEFDAPAAAPRSSSGASARKKKP